MSNNSTGLAAERLERTRDILKERRVARVDELCAELGVSAATVRRDLESLAARGHVRRVHGGALSNEGRFEEPLFDDKTAIAAREKQAIAAAAREFIEPNDYIYLDGGSTVLALARLLSDVHDLTVVTNSLRVATMLSGGGPRLILVGGELRRLSQTFVGALTQPMIEQHHFTKAFMGTIGLTLEEGMTTTEPNEAFTKQLVMAHAEQVFLLADSTKVGKAAFARAGGIADIDVLITDDALDPSFAGCLNDKSVRFIQACRCG
jgi:DeoR/GlpR family transcriptional regulator of sugar metabolism